MTEVAAPAVAGVGAEWTVEPVSGGTQNFMVRLRHGDSGVVLRKPANAETARREGRVLAALAGTGVPHARLVTAGDDFLVTDEVDGYNPAVAVPDAHDTPALSFAMVEALAPVGAVRVEGLGKPDGWLERQVRRWRSQLQSYADLDGGDATRLPGVEAVGAWLDAHRPDTWVPGLIHGDFHFGNVLVRHDRPEVAAIVDWELATTGDPLLDLAHFVVTSSVLDFAPVALPPVSTLADRYTQLTGRDTSNLDWYQALAAYRLGIILEGTMARANAGKAPRETGDDLHRKAVALLDQARASISH